MAVNRLLRTPSPLTPKIFFDTDIATEDELYGNDGFNGVTIGICSMNCKSCSQPMKEILSRMTDNNVRVMLFTDDTILNVPVEQWSSCDALIAFYSKGYPLDKVMDYVRIKKPTLVVNDLEMQYKLLDRRQVYRILEENDIDVPKYYVLDRNSGDEVIEMDDTIEINGQSLSKPFVEKPVSAEDHSVYVYFPSDYGGGSQRLFRKVRDRSSNYSKESTVRKSGSFLYEEFLATDGTDVKVYTVGPDYAHAEARKSPTLDGRVDRDNRGKEKRYPVILTAREKLIARKVCLAFKQTVCGFDMLRTDGKTYVCDVNGFSFVKSSEKYYDDCAQILLETILSKVGPHLFPQIAPTVEYLAPAVPVPIPSGRNRLQLRCVIGVLRHSDRTPKQKMKMIVKDTVFFSLFTELGGYRKGTLKLKKPKDLQRILDIACKLLDNLDDDDPDFKQKLHKYKQLKNVLQMYSHFSGINRKVQFKLINRTTSAPVLLLILKWGGVLTPSGEMCAEELGKAFRCMYPGGEGEYSSLPGSGFLRLHSTYRHDLKVYASDEGRVQLTAAAFTKGLLDLEGSVASIVVHLVKRDQNATNMLDTSTDATEALNNVKSELHKYMQCEHDFTEEQIHKIGPTKSEPLLDALHSFKNPHVACEKLYQRICTLLEKLNELSDEIDGEDVLYQGEAIQLMMNRWNKLKKDFKLDNGQFDISKIPDIYDCVKYDLQHNRSQIHAEALPVYKSVVQLADIVIPQEYGITIDQKLDISKKICSSLMKKIRSDLRHTYSDGCDPDILHRLDPEKSHGVISPNRNVRTRLYFTSESHIHSLVNMLKYGSLLKDLTVDSQTGDNQKKFYSFPEWNYLTQIVFMVFEDISKPSGEGLQVEVHISPGVKSREMILTKEIDFHDHQISTLDLPIVINPSSARFRRRSKQQIYENTIQTKSEMDLKGYDDDDKHNIIPHSHPGRYKTINEETQIIERSKSDTVLSELCLSDDETHTTTTTTTRPAKIQQSIGAVGNNDSYISLVSVVEPLICLCSVPIVKVEQSLTELIGNDD